jgi:hypothetical protein
MNKQLHFTLQRWNNAIAVILDSWVLVLILLLPNRSADRLDNRSEFPHELLELPGVQ